MTIEDLLCANGPFGNPQAKPCRWDSVPLTRKVVHIQPDKQEVEKLSQQVILYRCHGARSVCRRCHDLAKWFRAYIPGRKNTRLAGDAIFACHDVISIIHRDKPLKIFCIRKNSHSDKDAIQWKLTCLVCLDIFDANAFHLICSLNFFHNCIPNNFHVI